VVAKSCPLKSVGRVRASFPLPLKLTRNGNTAMSHHHHHHHHHQQSGEWEEWREEEDDYQTTYQETRYYTPPQQPPPPTVYYSPPQEPPPGQYPRQETERGYYAPPPRPPPEQFPGYYGAPLAPPAQRAYARYTPPPASPGIYPSDYLGRLPSPAPQPMALPQYAQNFHPELGSQYQYQYSQCNGRKKVSPSQLRVECVLNDRPC